ncbi:2-dehydro-3-deoxy-6-phosphogalactonate aldolase [Atlantibacter subterraneus]|uniref:2-dehydro-3-deoxy-6-phosphogalactonate aldolase n=1 Tax=Atlantibacter subterraneus TaxID=255519 RepID=UPI00289A6994|nr:2-dehydro-3-deoxy-6-phosphogalactonate aldolase [Atlantibacter subterranea]
MMDYRAFSTLWQQTTLPLVAILRGLTPEDAPAVAEGLLTEGFTWLEVPLNSPDALTSIALLREQIGSRGYVGAGTVLTAQQVDAVADAGGQIIISPNMSVDVIRRSRERGLISMPGVITPSEAFTALQAGASALKLFPAESVEPGTLSAWRAVLPAEVVCLPVGGIQPDAAQMRAWRNAGAQGFGLGGGLYRRADDAQKVQQKARDYREAWRNSHR